MGLWLRVVGGVAPDLSSAPLALVGMASWISGNGALLNCAGEELSRRHPGYSMGLLLEQISARAIPPRLWQSVGVRFTTTCAGSSHGWPGEAP